MIHLYQVQDDTINIPVDFTLITDSLTALKQYLHYPWEERETYVLTIDSGTVQSIYNKFNNGYEQKFTIQKLEYYGKIDLTIENIKNDAIVQLVSTSKEESVIESRYINGASTVEFNYLKPTSYNIKLILDTNGNQKWDPGSYTLGIQPEKVFYYHKTIPVRSNWELKELWTVDVDNPNPQKPQKPDTETTKKTKKRNRTPSSSRSGRSMTRPGGGMTKVIRN